MQSESKAPTRSHWPREVVIGASANLVAVLCVSIATYFVNQQRALGWLLAILIVVALGILLWRRIAKLSLPLVVGFVLCAVSSTDLAFGTITYQLGIHPSWLLPTALFLGAAIMSVVAARGGELHSSYFRQGERIDDILMSQSGRLGRHGDTQDILQLLKSHQVLHLTGESGVGKSSLLRFQLTESLAQSGYAPVYVEYLGEQWDESESAIVYGHLMTVAQACRVPVRARTSILTVIKELCNAGHVPVLIFDEFNGYLRQHRAKLLDEADCWIRPSDVVDSSRFWKQLIECATSGQSRIILAARSDESEGLHSFALDGYRSRPLMRIPVASVQEIIDDITSTVEHPDRGWKSLADRIVQDLDHGGYVLPIEIVELLSALKTMTKLTVIEYDRFGGMDGLIGRKIRNDVDAAAKAANVPIDALLLCISYTYSNDAEEENSCTALEFSEILKRESNLEIKPARLNKALEVLAQRRITRQIFTAGKDGLRWTCYHRYIGRAVAEVMIRRRSFERRLAAAHAAAVAARKSKTPRPLLGPVFICQIVVMALLGKVQLKNRLRFVLKSAAIWCIFAALGGAIPLVLADRGADIPLGAEIRSWIDANGLSVWRRVASDHDMLTCLEHRRDALLAEIRSRRDNAGWIRSTPELISVDPWAHSQACYAILLADESAEATSEVYSSFCKLFSESWRISSDGQAYGWSQTWSPEKDAATIERLRTESLPRAEILFWTAMATYRLLGRIDNASSSVVMEWCRYLDDAMGTYWSMGYGGAEGAWNRYPNQAIGKEASVYISCLAASALLEAHRVGHSVGVDVHSRDDLLQSTCNWLWSVRTEANGRIGWSDEGHPSVLPAEGLSYQVVAILAKAAQTRVWEAPAGFVDQATNLVLRGSEDGISVSVQSRRVQSFQNSFGFTKSPEYPLTFLTYPWFLACNVALKELHDAANLEFNLRRADRNRLKSCLSQAVVHEGEEHLAGLIGLERYSYIRAEALIGMESVRHYLERER